jgi:hypothetical protein
MFKKKENKMEKIKIECKECAGTGVYVGRGERDGYAVVCHKCNGKGFDFFKYKEFTGRKKKEGVEHVIEKNVGVVVGLINEKDACNYHEFGGMPYWLWLKKGKFPQKTEMRKYVCPKWWYFEDNKFYLKNCENDMMLGQRYTDCSKFEEKEKCWEAYDLYKRI